jgi:hypothetical protein
MKFLYITILLTLLVNQSISNGTVFYHDIIGSYLCDLLTDDMHHDFTVKNVKCSQIRNIENVLMNTIQVFLRKINPV